jgi:catechol 2,3-dioxygenase-like lactoylglutathione lyase family enzyme
MRDHPGVLSDAAPAPFVPSTDLDRSRAFYEGTLGVRLLDATPARLTFDVAGAKLSVVLVGDTLTPQPFTIFGWEVADIDASVAALAERGVEFLRYDGFDQDAAGIWTAPSGTRVAWFEDPDANNLSLND